MIESGPGIPPPPSAKIAAARFRCVPLGCEMGGAACGKRHLAAEAYAKADALPMTHERCHGCEHGAARARLLGVDAPPLARREAGPGFGRRRRADAPVVATMAPDACPHHHIIPNPHNHHWSTCSACGADDFPSSPEAAGQCTECMSYGDCLPGCSAPSRMPAPPPDKPCSPCVECGTAPKPRPAPPPPQPPVPQAPPHPAHPDRNDATDRADESLCVRCGKKPARPHVDVWPEACATCCSSAMTVSKRLVPAGDMTHRRAVEAAWLTGDIDAAKAKAVAIGALALCVRCNTSPASGALPHRNACGDCAKRARQACKGIGGKMAAGQRGVVEAAWLTGGVDAAAKAAFNVRAAEKKMEAPPVPPPAPPWPPAAVPTDRWGYMEGAAKMIEDGCAEVRAKFAEAAALMDESVAHAAFLVGFATRIGIDPNTLDLPGRALRIEGGHDGENG